MYTEKDQKLAALARSAETKKRLRTIQSIRKENSKDRETLKMAIYGDTQRTKNILQNHKDLQRLFQHMPSHMIIENMDQRTFVKRKELDRLVCKRNQLTAKYQYELVSSFDRVFLFVAAYFLFIFFFVVGIFKIARSYQVSRW